MNTTVRELMLAGAHFGHRARFWNSKMAPYIYCKYHSTHIINLDHTIVGMERSFRFIKSIVVSGGTVLFLCTKRDSSAVIEEKAKSVGMPYVSHRWLGGILTNFKTTRNSVRRLETIEADIESGVLKNMTKKEGIKLMIAKDKLEKSIGGIRDMKELPQALFVIDAGWHQGAILEARKLGIPVISVVDTNHSPDGIDYVIPGNDDSVEAVKIYVREATNTVYEGKKEWERNLVAEVVGGRSDSKLAGAGKPDKMIAESDEKKKTERRVIRTKVASDKDKQAENKESKS